MNSDPVLLSAHCERTRRRVTSPDMRREPALAAAPTTQADKKPKANE
jgi:hypothetical protein